jgi:GGDEF domain-containing protein
VEGLWAADGKQEDYSRSAMFGPRSALRFVARHSLVVVCVSSCILVAVALIAPPLVVAAVAGVELLVMGLLAGRVRERWLMSSGAVETWHAHARTWQSRAEAWESRASSLAEVVTVDEVTGLGNFREFEFEWWHCLARFHRRAEPFSVSLIEVTDAAENPQPLSTTVMRSVSRLLLQTARSVDTVFRVDERLFAVLLAAARQAGGYEFVDRARIVISSKPLDDNGQAVHVTTRGGVAEWRPEMQSMARMLKASEDDLRRFGDEKRRQEAYFEPDGGRPGDGGQRKAS